MKLLWICHFPVYGGPHNLALRLAAPLREAGVQLTALVPTEPGNAADRLRQGGVDTVAVPLHRVRAAPRQTASLVAHCAGDVRRTRSVIRERGIDAVVIGGLANPHSALAARLEGVALVWQILDSRSPAALRRAVMPCVRRWADAVMFNGTALVQMHLRGRPLEQPSFTFTGAVDSDHFAPSRDLGRATRRRFGVPEDALFVGTVANLNPMKGIEYFIRAAALIHRQRPDAWFLLSGASYDTQQRYRAQLEEEMAGSGIARERFVLSEEPPDDHYAALDVKLICSVPRSEGTTTTALEAMSSGVAVVATDVGAISEVVEDGVTGLVVAPLDPAALAGAALRLAADPELRHRLGSAGRSRVVERYGLEHSVDVHLRAITAACTRASRRSASAAATR